MSIDWGDAPTWVAAFFAAGAAAFAGGTLRSQRQQITEQRAFIEEQSANLALEREALRAAADDRRWAQARRIYALLRLNGGTLDDEGNRVGYDSWEVEVRNESDSPVRQVTVRFGDVYDAQRAEDASRRHLPGGGRHPGRVDIIGAENSVTFYSPRLSEVAVDNHPPMVLFTDDAGIAWQLDRLGNLAEVTSDGA
ncbi:hypothetical protein ACFTXJ_15375 [Streptomyces zhihengii]|uniref:hypothetical protein n=1 Tax=Streptomyces zhihengii TaxID=1818004 RepID=UPI0036314018